MMWAGWDSTASAGTWDGTGSTFRTYYSVASTSAYDIEMAEERALAKIRLYLQSRNWMPALRVIGRRVFGFIQLPVYHPKFSAAFWTGRNFHK
jgi:hypothetical protein